MPVPGRTLVARLVWPVVGLVLAAVLANVAFATWLATRGAVFDARQRRERIVAALERSRITLSQPVVDALAELTGSDLVVWDAVTDAPGESTMPTGVLAAATGDLRVARDGDVIVIGGRPHAVGLVQATGVRPERALVLTPATSLTATVWTAAWPVLAVAAATLAVLVPLGLATTSTIARRIGSIERRVERIAAGDFSAHMAEADAGCDDEVGRLAAGIERMRGDLESLRSRLVTGERERLLGQLAAGFAHELRNAITGARLAIDLHRRRCGGKATSRVDDSLAVACRQLDIVEEEVRGLLALGKPPTTALAPVDLDALADEVRDLVWPRCAHAGIALQGGSPCGSTVVGRRDGLRAALVNLALNAIDAAGGGGHVTVAAETERGSVTLVVEDDGPGPPAALADALHEPFVTGKREGVGLGLAVARAVAEQHGGSLAWRRTDGRTRFEIHLPVPTVPPAEVGA